jgi:hypothetical protein
VIAISEFGNWKIQWWFMNLVMKVKLIVRK